MGFHLSEKLKVNFYPAGYLKTSLKHTSHSSTEWRICRENSGSILKISYVALHFISNGFKRDKDITILSVNGKLLCMQDTVLINAFLTHFLNCNNTSDFFSFLNVVFFFSIEEPILVTLFSLSTFFNFHQHKSFNMEKKTKKYMFF